MIITYLTQVYIIFCVITNLLSFNKGVSPESLLPEIQQKGNPCTNHFDDGKCERCSGDCDSDDDCEEGLVCFQRSKGQYVPGCSWGAGLHNLINDWDYSK